MKSTPSGVEQYGYGNSDEDIAPPLAAGQIPQGDPQNLNVELVKTFIVKFRGDGGSGIFAQIWIANISLNTPGAVAYQLARGTQVTDKLPAGVDFYDLTAPNTLPFGVKATNGKAHAYTLYGAVGPMTNDGAVSIVTHRTTPGHKEH